jgi:hypothetical protein
MTLTLFEELCRKVLAQHLPTIRDERNEAKAEELLSAVLDELEQTALNNSVEVCERGAYLLVLARYDMALEANADALGVPANYFVGSRPAEEEAYAYLHQRRCGAPAQHIATKL